MWTIKTKRLEELKKNADSICEFVTSQRTLQKNLKVLQAQSKTEIIVELPLITLNIWCLKTIKGFQLYFNPFNSHHQITQGLKELHIRQQPPNTGPWKDYLKFSFHWIVRKYINHTEYQCLFLLLHVTDIKNRLILQGLDGNISHDSLILYGFSSIV